VTSAPASTTASTARCGPNRRVIKFAIAATEPLSSISLPNSAPSRNSGKNCARKPAALTMKVWVQWASSGSLENNAAIKAANGASSSTLQPRKANETSRPSPIRMPRSPDTVIISAFREQGVDVGGGVLSDILAVGREECAGALAPLFLQQRNELPLGVELRRRTEVCERVAHDPVRAHSSPARAFAVSGVRHLAQQCHHAQLLHQRRVERNLVEPVEDLVCRARRVRPFARIDLHQDGVVGITFAHQRRKGGIAGVAAIPIGLALDLDRLEHGRQTGRGQENIGRDLRIAEDAAAAGPHVGRGDEQLDWRAGQSVEIDALDEDGAQWVEAER